MSIEQTVKTDATAALTWLQKHERIIIVALVLLAGSWFGDHWLNNTADKDKQQATIAAQQLDEQKTKDTQLASQVSQLTTQYANVTAQLTAANEQLSSAMAQRVVVLHDQQAADKTMPLPDLGNRWAQLASIPPTDITASTAGITVSDTAARQTVEQLEKVPVLTANLQDETTEADNRQKELDNANSLIGGLNTQVSGLKLTITDEETSCKAQVTSANAQARKSKVKWFKVGFITGFVVGFAADHLK